MNANKHTTLTHRSTEIDAKATTNQTIMTEGKEIVTKVSAEGKPRRWHELNENEEINASSAEQ